MTKEQAIASLQKFIDASNKKFSIGATIDKILNVPAPDISSLQKKLDELSYQTEEDKIHIYLKSSGNGFAADQSQPVEGILIKKIKL